MDELNNDVKSFVVPTDLTDNVDCNIINENIKDFDNGLCDAERLVVGLYDQEKYFDPNNSVNFFKSKIYLF